MRSRLLASLLVLVAMALSPRSARADAPRPADAPLSAGKRSAELPLLPVEAELGAEDRAAVEARWSDDRTRRYAFLPAIVVVLTAAAIVAFVWTAVARKRRAKMAAAAQNARARKERRDAAPKPHRAPAKVTAAARLIAGRGRDAAIHMPRDPEVPKVEHNGEWHTLH